VIGKRRAKVRNNPPAQLTQTYIAVDAEAPEPLPVFGCAVSTRLQKSLNPLSLVFETLSPQFAGVRKDPV